MKPTHTQTKSKGKKLGFVAVFPNKEALLKEACIHTTEEKFTTEMINSGYFTVSHSSIKFIQFTREPPNTKSGI